MILRIVLFYVLTFLFTVVLGGAQEATGVAAGWLTLPQLAPGLAALVMLLLFRRDGLRLSLGMPAGPRLLLALLAAPAVAAAVYLAWRPAPGELPVSLWLLLPGMAIGAFGEELGWRGYLHRRIDARLSPLVSSVVVGVLWALWHVGAYQNGPVYMAFLVLLMVSYSIVLYRLLAGSRFNVWLAAAFHLGINLGNLPFLGVINDVSFMGVSAIVWAAIAAVVVIRRRDLFLRAGAPPVAVPATD